MLERATLRGPDIRESAQQCWGEVAVAEGFAGQKLSGENVLPGFELPPDEMRLQG